MTKPRNWKRCPIWWPGKPCPFDDGTRPAHVTHCPELPCGNIDHHLGEGNLNFIEVVKDPFKILETGHFIVCGKLAVACPDGDNCTVGSEQCDALAKTLAGVKK